MAIFDFFTLFCWFAGLQSGRRAGGWRTGFISLHHHSTRSPVVTFFWFRLLCIRLAELVFYCHVFGGRLKTTDGCMHAWLIESIEGWTVDVRTDGYNRCVVYLTHVLFTFLYIRILYFFFLSFSLFLP